MGDVATRDQFREIVGRDVLVAVADTIFDPASDHGVVIATSGWPTLKASVERGGTVDEWVALGASMNPYAPRPSYWRVVSADAAGRRWFAVAPGGIVVHLLAVAARLGSDESSWLLHCETEFAVEYDARFLRLVRIV